MPKTRIWLKVRDRQDVKIKFKEKPLVAVEKNNHHHHKNDQKQNSEREQKFRKLISRKIFRTKFRKPIFKKSENIKKKIAKKSKNNCKNILRI